MNRRVITGLIIGATTIGVSSLPFGFLELFEPPSYYHWKQERIVRRVLTADPQELLNASREVLLRHQGLTGRVHPSSLTLPAAIRRLRPTEIYFLTNAVSVDFSDVFNPFGITAYAVGAKPPHPSDNRTPTLWIEGLWVFDDGQLEKYGRHLGWTNGIPPMPSKSN